MKFSDDDLAWAYLSRVTEGPCAPLAELIAHVGAVEAAAAVREGGLPEVVEKKVRARREWDCAQRDLECAHANGFQLLTPYHPHWPHASFQGFHYSAMHARSVRDSAAAAPTALWVKGDSGLLHCGAVAVVGSRHPSTEGQRVTTELSIELAAENIALVSGLACGVDTLVHQAALCMGVPTVAVVACGLDRVYPAQNAALFRDIASNGVVFSEYPPGTRPARYRFLARNRLLAALSQGVVVTSASWRSGALNTASWARDLGRPVMAVPHGLQDVDGAGCHRLIREGATLVTRSVEIIEEVGPMGQLALPLEAAPRASDGLCEQETRVWNAISPFFSSSEAEICSETGLETSDVRKSLKNLLGCRLVTVSSGRWTRNEETLNDVRVSHSQSW